MIVGDTIRTLVVAVIAMLIGWSVLSALIRNRGVNRFLDRLASIDNSWDKETLEKRAKAVYEKVKPAVLSRRYTVIGDMITQGLYERLKASSPAGFGFRESHFPAPVLHTSFNIVEVLDYRDDSKDRFGVYVSFVSLGSPWGLGTPNNELWTFIRRGDEWVLDDLRGDFDSFEEVGARLFSEELSAGKEDLVIVAEPTEEGGRYRYEVGYKKDHIRKYRK